MVLIWPFVDTHEACRRAAQLMWMIIISARLLEYASEGEPSDRIHVVIEPARSIEPTAEAINPISKADTITASILRTHSQCQRWGEYRPETAPRRGTGIFINLENLWSV